MASKTLTRTLAAFSVASLSVAAVACSTDDNTNANATTETTTTETSAHDDHNDSESDADAEFNDTDVEFNQMMIAHHQQALDMAALIDGRTDNPDILQLGATIEETQAPEMDAMQARLDEWGVSDDYAHGGHEDMDGMLDDEQMTALSDASGTDFDRLFLEGMIEHHEGAIDMAQDELDNGIDEQSRQIAEDVISAQASEIAEMNALLDDLE
ncbi:DUF305 domain-containing protein [Corynebacterium sputi]|uniref:DUF305 domain-containing protein n=1 Tax=Corynebacterium sputi TaxID=489915 RepID=UPI00041236F0|nr:DUF305 domain-containing protein [Corynebacterium sputi]